MSPGQSEVGQAGQAPAGRLSPVLPWCSQERHCCSYTWGGVALRLRHKDANTHVRLASSRLLIVCTFVQITYSRDSVCCGRYVRVFHQYPVCLSVCLLQLNDNRTLGQQGKAEISVGASWQTGIVTTETNAPAGSPVSATPGRSLVTNNGLTRSTGCMCAPSSRLGHTIGVAQLWTGLATAHLAPEGRPSWEASF